MKADAITARIIEDAKTQAERVLDEARAKTSRIEKDLDAELTKKRSESEQATEKQVADMRDRMLRMAQLDQKKEMLAVKRELIDMAFNDALKRINQMSAGEKRKYIVRLMTDSAEGGESVIPSCNEKALFDDKLISEVNSALQKAGKQPVTLSNETRDIGGGFVLSKGGMEINCAYKAVVGQFRASLEAQVAQTIFN